MAFYRTISSLALALAIGMVQAVPTAVLAADDQLTAIREKVRQTFPTVKQLSPDEFQSLRSGKTPVVVLDVREADEFAVSHIDGARRVDPSISAADFQKAFGESLNGATVVLYCSVGMRSSNLATRIASTARQSGATAVYNLDGGLFRWHNESRPLVKGDKPTDEVHGYNFVWRRHLQRQDHVTTN